MILVEDYLKNPCGTLSIPYWKHQSIVLPNNMKIVHQSKYRKSDYLEYKDETYFRLFHSLNDIENFGLDGYEIETVAWDVIPCLVDIINQSYSDMSVTYEQLIGYTQTTVYDSSLWILVREKKSDSIVGSGIADLDKELQEGIIEWVQVLPDYRGRKIGRLIVNELLRRMSKQAKFATVSGKVADVTKPQLLYRRCGFVGDDIWHILTK